MNEQKDQLDFDGKVFKLLYRTNVNPSIEIGDKVAWSPVGSGIIKELTDRGYPKVNHVAVSVLVTEKGLVFGALKDQIIRAARKLNKVAVFSYFNNNTYNHEGTGDFSNIKFGNFPYLCNGDNFYLEWKIAYVEQEQNTSDWKVSYIDKEKVTPEWKITYAEEEKTGQQQLDENRLQAGVDVATHMVERIFSNNDLSDKDKKDEVIKYCATWIQIYAQETSNTKFYKELLTGIGMMFGEEAKTSDDGSIQEDILVLKIPDLVCAAVKDSNELKRLKIPFDGRLNINNSTQLTT